MPKIYDNSQVSFLSGLSSAGQDLIIGEKGGDLIADAFDDKEAGIAGFQSESEENNNWFFTDFDSFYKKAEEAYKRYKNKNNRSLRWISSGYFTDKLKEDLKKDTDQFILLLKQSKNWNPEKDLKLKKLENLINEREEKKVLIFTQSRQTACYLRDQLETRGVKNLSLITGSAGDFSFNRPV